MRFALALSLLLSGLLCANAEAAEPENCVSLDTINESYQVLDSGDVPLFTEAIFNVEWNRDDYVEMEGDPRVYGAWVSKIARKPFTGVYFKPSEVQTFNEFRDDRICAWGYVIGKFEIDSCSVNRDRQLAGMPLQLSWQRRLVLVYSADENEHESLPNPIPPKKMITVQDIPIRVRGDLGFPLGSPVEVKGRWKRHVAFGPMFYVEEVNGRKPARQVIWPRSVVRWHDFCRGEPASAVDVSRDQTEVPWIMHGCEVVRMDGVPPGEQINLRQVDNPGFSSEMRVWKIIKNSK